MKTFKNFIENKKIVLESENIWDTDTIPDLLNSGLDAGKSAYYFIKYKLNKSKIKNLLDKELDGAKNITDLEISKLESSKSVSNNDLIEKLNNEKSKIQENLDDLNDDIRIEKNDQILNDYKKERDILKKKIAEINKKLSLYQEHTESTNKIKNLTLEQIDSQIENLKLNISNLIKETDKIVGNNPISKRFVAKERLNNTIIIGKMMLDSKSKISEEEKNSIENRIKEAENQQNQIQNTLNSLENNTQSTEVSTEISDIKELPTEILKLFTIINNLKSISNDDILKYKTSLEDLIEKNKDNKNVKKSELIKQFNEVVKSKKSKEKPKSKKSEKEQLSNFILNKKIANLTTELENLDKELESNMNIIKNPNSISDPEIAVKLNDLKTRTEAIKLEINKKEQELAKLKEQL